MKKRILSILLVAMMIAVLLPMAALADGNVAEINGQGYATFVEAANAIKDGETLVLLQNCSMADCPSAFSSKGTITITAITDDIVLDFGGDSTDRYATGTNLIFKNLTIQANVSDFYKGWKHCASETYENCHVTGQIATYGASFAKFVGCDFYQRGDNYSIFVYNDNAIIDDCSFDVDGKAVKFYNEGTSLDRVLIVANCDFVGNGTDKAAIAVDDRFGDYVLALVGDTNTVSGTFADKGLFEVKQDTAFVVENAVVNEKNEIVSGTVSKEIPTDLVDAFFAPGTKIVSDGEGGFIVKEPVYVAKIGSKGYETLEAAFAAAKATDTIELVSDVDFEGSNWTPVSFSGTFDGNGFSIKNMTINDTAHAYTGFFSILSGTIKNVTFENANVTGQRTGIVAGAVDMQATFDGVNVVDSKVFGEQKCGGIIGFVRGQDDAGAPAEFVLNDCHVTNLVFDENTPGGTVAQCGGLIGYVTTKASLTVTNCSVENIVINNDWYSSEEGQAYNNVYYKSNEFIGAIDNRDQGEAYGTRQIVLSDNEIKGPFNEGLRRDDGKAGDFIGGFAAFDGSGSTPAQIIIDGEEPTSELTFAKDQALDALNQKLLTVESDAAKSYINSILNSAKNSIKDATTAADVEKALNNALADIAGMEQQALAEAQYAAHVAIANAMGESYSTEVLAIATAADAAIDGADTIAAVTALQEEAIAAIEAQQALESAKADAIAAIDAAVDGDASENVVAAANAAKDAINAATSTDEVSAALSTGTSAIAAAKDANALAQAKADALNTLDQYAADKGIKDKSVIDAAKAAINNAGSIDQVNNALAQGKSAVDQQYNSENPPSNDGFFVKLFNSIGKIIDSVISLFKNLF